MTMDDLDRVIASPDLMPPGVDVQSLGRANTVSWPRWTMTCLSAR